MEKIANYIITKKIAENRKSIIYRGRNDEDNTNVIIKVLKTQYPTPSEVARFKQEFKLIKEMNLDGVIKAYDFIDSHKGYAIIEEDFESVSLKNILNDGKFNINIFLQAAVKISEIIGNLHKENIIHLDIKPDNILINTKTESVKITDFGISTVLTHENDEIYNPAVIQGTLAYMSPEQTGRMNRDMDYRTDIYSLGITFYEMLTGELPFKTDEPMEMIHSHIAKQPTPPYELDPLIPEILSDIILKMMAKMPEERYQNCFGLMSDIQECLNQLTDNNEIKKFQLNMKDLSLRFNIPQILVGREDEKYTLMSSFDRVSKGASEMMLVAGHPGIGKSALVNEIHKPIVAEKGYFISGKYDQFGRDVPYSSIIQAFIGLIKQILTENEKRISLWKENLISALGPNGKIIIDVIPELELLIGEQPEVSVPGPEESQNRFNLVFQNFINVFADEQHPLVLFLDDLQWADTASINLIKTIITNHNIKNFLLICAYRDNEVSGSHPFIITVEEIKKRNIQVNNIYLEPLDVGDINQLLTSVLKCEPKVSIPLSELVKDKTGGNPFFVNQFCKTLYDDGYLVLDSVSGWNWDMVQIGQMQVTDNVVELMANKISKMSKKTQDVLKICACIGNRFDLETIATVSEKSIEEILSDMTTAIHENYIILKGDMYRFHHDRIQEAAYSLISDDDRIKIHYFIGHNMLKKTKEENIGDKIFYIVDHLNRGIKLISEYNEKIQLAKFNLMAGEKAKNSTAYGSALIYLETSLALMPEDFWNTHYEITYSIYCTRLECEYLNLNFDEAKNTFRIISRHAKTNIDIANAYVSMIILHTIQGDYEEAARFGLEGIGMVGRKCPRKVSELRLGIELFKLRVRFGRKKIEDLPNIPFVDDPEILSYIDLILFTATVSYYIDANLFAYFVIDSVNTILKYGNYEESPFAFDAIGSIIGSALGFYKHGYRFGEIALSMMENIGSSKNRCRVEFLFSMFILHTRKHAKFSIDYFRNAYKHGLEEGDLIYCHHSVNLLGMYRIILGDNIDVILEEYKKYDTFQKESKDPFVALNYIDNVQMCYCLKGMTDKSGSLDRGDYKENQQLEKYFEENNLLGAFYIMLIMIRIKFIFGNYTECMHIGEKLSTLVKQKISLGSLHVPEFNFYYSLSLTACYKTSGLLKKIGIRKQLVLNQMKMKKWANNCSENYLHKYLLIRAEISRIKMKNKKAAKFYNEAIGSARENAYTQNEAIANELAAKFWNNNSDMTKAKNYLSSAHHCYYRWGATSKVDDLEENFPQLLSGILRSNVKKDGTFTKTESTSIAGTGSQSLDISTIIKTSQALSSEIEIDKLLKKILTLAIENAGAELCFLILENEIDIKLYIEATGGVNREIEVLKSIPIEKSNELSRSIVNYVKKAGEDIVLNDAAIDNRFVQDPYIMQNRPKSILCARIMNKGKMFGIIYLENNLTTGAFTDDRVELLRIISTQAAISIENSRLIKHRENEAKLRTEMNIAAEIQQAMLPKNPAIAGFEITAYMNPADDVGGDYYDIINTPERDWVVIGDVSGHGVLAGLIMMMVQTAIQTVVRKFPDMKPSILLSAVNEAIKYNVENMSQQKYMTINVFSFRKDGTAMYSGLHQDLIIYRSGKGEIERLASCGIWLSPWDLGHESVDSEFIMNPGDILLLYTDGITEAMDDEGKLYSEERLMDILAESSSLPTEKIRDRVLEEMEGFRTDDDVTMVVIKRV